MGNGVGKLEWLMGELDLLFIYIYYFVTLVQVIILVVT